MLLITLRNLKGCYVKKYLISIQGAKFLGVSVDTVRRLMHNGVISESRHPSSRMIFIDKRLLEKFVFVIFRKEK